MEGLRQEHERLGLPLQKWRSYAWQDIAALKAEAIRQNYPLEMEQEAGWFRAQALKLSQTDSETIAQEVEDVFEEEPAPEALEDEQDEDTEPDAVVATYAVWKDEDELWNLGGFNSISDQIEGGTLPDPGHGKMWQVLQAGEDSAKALLWAQGSSVCPQPLSCAEVIQSSEKDGQPVKRRKTETFKNLPGVAAMSKSLPGMTKDALCFLALEVPQKIVLGAQIMAGKDQIVIPEAVKASF